MLFFLCDLVGGSASASDETAKAAFFRQDELPELSKYRVTRYQVERTFAHYRHPEWPTDFD